MKIKFILIFLLLFIGCNEPEKEKFQLILRIIENPEKYDSVIEKSKYFQNKFWQGHWDKMIYVTKRLDELKINGYKIGDCNYNIFRDENKIWLKYFITLISQKDANEVTFIFISKDSYKSREEGKRIIEANNPETGWYLNRIKPDGPDL